MFEIGATLREARERRGLTLADAEQVTRIRARYLAALEDERFGDLPGEAYARSFLREYGEFLGLEGEQLAAEYDLRFAKPEPTYVEPMSVRQRGRPWRGTLIALLVLIGCAVIVLAVLVPGSGQRASPKPAPSKRHARPTPILKPTRPRSRPAVPHLRLVAARGDCWLEVHAGSRRGPLLYEGILSRGGSLAFARRFLWMRIGAPASLDVRMNGKALPLVRSSSPLNVQFALRRLRVVS